MARTVPFAVLLRGVCLSALGLADEPASVPSATAEQVQQTVERLGGDHGRFERLLV